MFAMTKSDEREAPLPLIDEEHRRGGGDADAHEGRQHALLRAREVGVRPRGSGDASAMIASAMVVAVANRAVAVAPGRPAAATEP